MDFIYFGHNFSAEYKKGLSSHYPMAIIALSKLGATLEEVESFQNSYVKRLEKLEKPTFKMTEDNWQDYLGNHKYNSEYIEFFTEQISRSGIEGTLKRFIPILFPGVAAAAFHPLIRLGYGISIFDSNEIAHGLASFAMGYLPLNEGSRSVETIGLEESLKKLHDNDIIRKFSPKVNPIYNRMKATSNLEEFKFFSYSVSDLDLNLGNLAKINLKMYLSSNDNFTALHCLTATHALRYVLPFIENQKKALRYFWQAIGAAYVDAKMPTIKNEFGSVPKISFQEIFQKAIKTNDDHSIKLVFSCYEEFKEYKNPEYLLAAAKRVQLI